MSRTTRLTAFMIAAFALCAAGDVQAQNPQKKVQAPRPIPAETQMRQQINEWTVGLAGGLLEGAPIRLATEISRVVNDGSSMHVLPIVTRGPTENVNDLLFLRGVDMAIISSDSLEEYKAQVPDVQQRITYILNLFPQEVQILARPEVNSLRDLAGKKVNFNTQGTAAAFTGPMIFSRLGIDIQKMFIPHPVAMERMKQPNSDIAAVFFITSKPVDPFLKGRWEGGYHFLSIPYDPRFDDYYLPATLETADYPNLIPSGQRIDTIAAPTILTAYNWRPTSDRYRRVARFTEYLFSRIDKLQTAGFDPKWKDVNLNAKVPGLARFRAAQEWLDANTAKVGMRP